MDLRRIPRSLRRHVAELVDMQRRIEEGEREAALRARVEAALVAARLTSDPRPLARPIGGVGWTRAHPADRRDPPTDTARRP